MHWIIGDIHGMLGPLEALLEAIADADRDAQLCFAGDYVNRGPDSRGVIDLLLTLPNARFIRGNHDDIFAQVLLGHTYCPNASQGNRFLAFMWFMRHGLSSTLTSYGADPAELEDLAERPSEQRLDDVLTCVPESHRRFIRHLEPLIEQDDFFVAHGLWEIHESDMQPPMLQRLAGSARHRETILWGRFTRQQILANKAWHRTGYFGHTPVECYPDLLPDGEPEAIRGPKIVLVDSGCALGPSGRLTAFCHETQIAIQVSHYADLITSR